MIAPKILAIAALMTGACSAFTLPEGLEDGLYRAYRNANGTEVHEPLDVSTLPRVNSKRSTAASRVMPRQGYGFGGGILESWCGCGLSMNHADCDAATADIENQVNIPGQDGVLIPWGQSYYSIRGSVVAFACNDDWGQEGPYGALDGGVDVAYFVGGFQYITDRCGWYVPGTMIYLPWSPPDEGGVGYISPFVGYMNYNAGLDFCTAAGSSSASTC